MCLGLLGEMPVFTRGFYYTLKPEIQYFLVTRKCVGSGEWSFYKRVLFILINYFAGNYIVAIWIRPSV